MGYPLNLALRYLGSKKRRMISTSTILAIGGVMLGVAALTSVMSVTGGFQEQFRDKVLGVNAHVLVLKYSIDFREYRDVMKKVEGVPHVIGTAPFVINPMMVTHGEHTATGVLLKGVDPVLMPKVLDRSEWWTCARAQERPAQTCVRTEPRRALPLMAAGPSQAFRP